MVLKHLRIQMAATPYYPSINKQAIIMLKKLLFTLLISAISAVISVNYYIKASLKETEARLWRMQQAVSDYENAAYSHQTGQVPVIFAGNPARFGNGNGGFIEAAKIANPTVVNIAAMRLSGSSLNNPFGELFGDKGADWFGYNAPYKADAGLSNGSGVIVSTDGYIVTNHHVIEGSNQIQVTLYDKRTFTATLVGSDPSTDIALLRINASALPAIQYGNSDELEVGEWVMAVGNPFNLASTVTAGIVSAKGRNINILKEESAIEAFIQTDAAVNQGNSGGALVNLRGELVGINTAIATPSGSYAGYSFAVPVNIAVKVIDDLKTYGFVQRAYLGINTRDITPEIASQLKLKDMNGVYVEFVSDGGAGAEAGLKKDDIITEVNGYKVASVPEFKEKVGRFRPGDVIGITYLRNGQMVYTKMALKNAAKTAKPVGTPKQDLEKLLGAQFQELTPAEMMSLGTRNGIKVTHLTENGLLRTATSMKVGFIVLKVNNENINSIEDFNNAIQKVPKGDGVMLDGIYPNEKHKKLYAFSMK